MMRLAIHDAQCANGETFRRKQRHSGIEAHEGFINHQRIIGEALVRPGILDNKTSFVHDRVTAKRNVTWRLTGLYAYPSFEPLTVCINQTDQRRWTLTNVRCQPRKIVKCIFGISIEDLILTKCL